jgi:hypothetical protein
MRVVSNCANINLSIFKSDFGSTINQPYLCPFAETPHPSSRCHLSIERSIQILSHASHGSGLNRVILKGPCATRKSSHESTAQTPFRPTPTTGCINSVGDRRFVSEKSSCNTPPLIRPDHQRKVSGYSSGIGGCGLRKFFASIRYLQTSHHQFPFLIPIIFFYFHYEENGET